MGADADKVKTALLAWLEGSELGAADLELRHAAHVYHTATTAESKIAARQKLRLAAIKFAAEAQDLAVKGGVL